jgi:hypothetical protein
MVLFKFVYLFGLLSSITPRPVAMDTMINGIEVRFSYSRDIFPLSWQASPINAIGDAISPVEVQRSKMVIAEAINKYPGEVLRRDLQHIYFLRDMKFYNTPYGGTNSSDAVYLCNDGEKAGYTNHYLEQTFHHELSSILFRKHAVLLDTAKWKEANIPGFDYNDPENGVGSIRKNQTSQEIDTVLCLQGFLTQYSQSSMENDINTYAQNLFRPSLEFWTVAYKYPRVGRKMRLLIAFYQGIDPAFTEEFFRKWKDL